MITKEQEEQIKLEFEKRNEILKQLEPYKVENIAKRYGLSVSYTYSRFVSDKEYGVRQKKYYEQHKEKRKAYQKKYQAEYRKNNKEKLKKQKEIYIEKNREKLRNYQRQYQAQRRAKMKQLQQEKQGE